ncbi:presenilin family intramembrane aspartyl protease PSH [Halovivax asiaticus]|uniref:presenilin family intramembrane aspartyl protease PSH n=1 Tax=Halovivax asiaticus TaxID=332953 RepID=UPI000677B9D9|nr:presenilin family intramembrane aspartyl protease PSH [Halovivax asiaticus]
MNDRARVVLSAAGVVGIFLGVQFGALALVEPFQTTHGPAVENPQDPANSGVFFGVILVATAIMLAAFRYDGDRFIRWLIVGVSVMLSWYVFVVLIPPAVTVNGLNVLAVLASVGIGVGLLAYPEWYIIDAAGVVMAAGAAALFGISFGLFPAILFLSVLAIYDAISVYRTEHMLSLADGVLDLKIPVVFVVPATVGYSYIDDDGGRPDASVDDDDRPEVSEGDSVPSDASTMDSVSSDGEETTNLATDGTGSESNPTSAESDGLDRDALFIGLGDAVIPTILVASSVTFLDAPQFAIPFVSLTLPALGAIAGTTAGLVILLWMVVKGRAHAGLPLLNGGAIGGYLLGAVATGASLWSALGL